MWDLEPRGGTVRALASLAYFSAVALLVLLQELGLRLRREERRAWWAGNGRDVLNALGCAGVAAALLAHGFPFPAAVAAGATVTLAVFGTSIFFETQARVAHPRAWALAAALLVALPVLLFPGQTVRGLGRLLSWLFPLPA